MTPLHWTGTIAGMVFGYLAAGPVGGFAGLGLGWWLARPRPRARPVPSPAPDSRLKAAYRTLGVAPHATEDEVRTAYRRLMNRNHPDKLAASGSSATELGKAQLTTHEIRKAYDLIRKLKK
ncbi:MAG: DnaJ domain-containing protein [Aquisalimonadaceae bacterium]